MSELKVQFGCGGNKLEGWNNHDMDADITRPLPYPDSSVDFILIEHCLEHVSGPDGFKFMREAYRILKPDGILRICVPHLMAGVMTRDHISDLILGHGHLVVYSKESLNGMLWAAGFDYIVHDLPHRECDQHWKTIGREKDDLETIRVEAVK